MRAGWVERWDMAALIDATTEIADELFRRVLVNGAGRPLDMAVHREETLESALVKLTVVGIEVKRIRGIEV
jgi:hypothetical protein